MTTQSRDGSVRERQGWRRLASVVTRPEFTTDVLQIVKSVVAATAAWWFAVVVLDTSMPFLAPWVALLTVYPTVYQSVKRGAQTTVASWAGVGVSFLIGQYLGVNVWTFALAIVVGLAASRIPGIRNEGVAIATTAIFVLSDGFTEQQPQLFDRIVEVAVGAAVGLIVNLLLIPPLRDRQAARYVDHINRRMGDGPGRGARRRIPWSAGGTERIIVRTLREAAYAPGEWDTRFRERWVTILRDTGKAIADPDREVEPIDDRLVRLSADLSDDADLPTRSWPLYGSLITSLRHIARVVDDVASARAAREGGTANPQS